MDKTSVSIIIAASVALCGLLLFATFFIIAQLAPTIRKKSRIVNRKQFSRRRVEDELLHNIRYASPDSVSVSLAKIQPRSNRRQTLPAISLCQSYSTDSQSDGENTEYGTIELIRSTVRRYSDAGFSKPEPIDRTRKISLDSQLLSKICEESSELYKFETRRGSSISYSEFDVEMYSSTDEIGSSSMNSGCGLGKLHFIPSYNQSIGVFSVTIIKASYVRSSLMKETCRVYVKIALLPSELNYARYKTSCVTSMGNPLFNQTFTFHITEIPEQLQLIVKEVRKLESNKVVGYVWFDMTNLLKDNSSMNSGQEISREIFGENKLYRRRGDVLVNLKISINDAIEINVCVAEARNLMIRNQSS